MYCAVSLKLPTSREALLAREGDMYGRYEEFAGEQPSKHLPGGSWLH